MMESRLAALQIPFPFSVAPMVGLSHVAFRELIRWYCPAGVAPLLFTEMLSTRRLPTEKLGDVFELECAPGESFFVPQLLGNEERFIAPSIQRLMPLKPFAFDINMGCPVTHTLKHNWGVKLMGDVKYAAEVVRITKKHSPLPVSVKLRGSGDATLDRDELDHFTAALEDAGADWLTIHARAKAAGHKGKADYDLVGYIRSRRRIPIIANGGIQTADEAVQLLRTGRADGAMIARAATARPWILWQIAEDLGIQAQPAAHAGRRAPRTDAEEGCEYLQAAAKFAELLAIYVQPKFGDEMALKKYHFFTATGSRWFLFGHAFWKLGLKAKTLAQLRELLAKRLENKSHPMFATIDF